MPIITLTTDFGTADFYAGALKGALLRRCPDVQLIDISHQINSFDIVQAAFVLGNAWQEFPVGTIHLVGVNCVYGEAPRFVAARREGQYFLAPDNGILTLLLEDLSPADVRHLPADPREHFAVKNIFTNAAAHLVEGLDFEVLGEYAAPLLERISIQPVIMPNRIRGTIIHVDNFENAIVNIRREVFEKVGNGREFSLFFKRNDPISKLSDNYCDVSIGEPLCLFNSVGFLEIAVNLGKAASLLGLKTEDVVEVVFE
jgi:S-adenosyl-L-methionine hydrolase (adenosine-forming)